MKPFLHLSVRSDDRATHGEHLALLRHTGLQPDQLTHVRLEAAPLPKLDLTEFSGVLLGGSPYDWTKPDKDATQLRVEADLRALVARVIDADLPFFGACYGIGTLGAALGAPLGPDHAETAGAVRLTPTAAAADDELTADLPKTFDSFVAHRESLLATPAEATLLVTSATAPVQMFRVGANVYATQFHPELDQPAFIDRLALYDGHGYYPEGALASLDRDTAALDTSWANALLRRFATVYHR